jgi:hypothetical protein
LASKSRRSKNNAMFLEVLSHLMSFVVFHLMLLVLDASHPLSATTDSRDGILTNSL